MSATGKISGRVDQIRGNLRKRVDSIRDGIKAEVDTVTGSVGDLVSLKPVKAGTGLLKGTVDNFTKVVDTQADITRELIGR